MPHLPEYFNATIFYIIMVVAKCCSVSLYFGFKTFHIAEVFSYISFFGFFIQQLYICFLLGFILQLPHSKNSRDQFIFHCFHNIYVFHYYMFSISTYFFITACRLPDVYALL